MKYIGSKLSYNLMVNSSAFLVFELTWYQINVIHFGNELFITQTLPSYQVRPRIAAVLCPIGTGEGEEWGKHNHAAGQHSNMFTKS